MKKHIDLLMRRTKSNERGNVMVEFALVFLILVPLAIGTMEIARAVYAYAVISNAARDGAHFASLRPRIADGTADGTLDKDSVLKRISDVDLAGLDQLKVTAQVFCEINPQPDHQQFDPANPADECVPWNWVHVKILYEFHSVTALFPPITLSTESVMTIE